MGGLQNRLRSPKGVGRTYLTDFTSPSQCSFARVTHALEQQEDGTWKRYGRDVIRPHATRSRFYHLEGFSYEYCQENYPIAAGSRGLSNAWWTKTACSIHYFDSGVNGSYQFLTPATPIPEAPAEILCDGTGTAEVRSSALLGIVGGNFNMLFGRRPGTTLAHDVTIRVLNNAGTVLVSKVIPAASIPVVTKASDWLAVDVGTVTAPTGAPFLSIQIVGAAANDAVMVSLPSYQYDGSVARAYPRSPILSENFGGGAGFQRDQDVLLVLAGKIPAEVLGSGAWGVSVIMPRASSESLDWELLSVDISHDIVWANPGTYDGCLRIRNSDTGDVNPVAESKPITWSRGAVLDLWFNPVNGHVAVWGADTGNGICATRTSDGVANQPWNWTAWSAGKAMQIGERVSFPNTHPLDGWVSDLYKVPAF